MEFSKSVRLSISYNEAVPKVKEVFKSKGFGTLTEIDVQATLKEKIDVDMDPYLIIGACNPNLAHRALTIEPLLGLLLPCNVVVRKDGDGVVVDALDATVIATVPENPDLKPIAEEAGRLIGEALAELVEAYK